MQINQALKVMVLMGAISCSPSEPTNDQGPAPEPTSTNTTPDAQEQETKEDTKPEVRYYLLSEQ